MSTKSLYEVQTHNDSEASENRMHSDAVAQQYGFSGALVPGVTVFGHMCYLPLRADGVDWMTNNRAGVRFISPAYDGDVLTIEHEEQAQGGETLCIAADKKVLARMQHQHESRLQPAEWLSLEPAATAPERQPISWDAIHLHEPAPAHRFEVTDETNRKLARQIDDDLALFGEPQAPLHPFWLLRECNAAFVRSYILPAWIHVGSDISWHRPIHVGDTVEVRMVPIEKWDKKGHEFTKLYIAFLVDGEPRVEVEHTSIFRIATKSADRQQTGQAVNR